MLLTALTYIPPIIGLTFLGLTAILARRNRETKAFLVFALSGAIWWALQFAAELSQNDNTSLFLVRLGSLFGYVTAVATLVFIRILIRRKVINFFTVILIMGLVVFCAVSFTDLFISGIDKTGVGIAVTAGPLYTVQTILLTLAIFAGFIEVIAQAVSKHEVRGRNITLILALAIPIVANAFLALFFADSPELQFIGPLSVLMTSILLFYAMAEHRFLDIRLIVARSLGYLLSVGALAVLYGLISFAVINLMLPESASLNVERGTYTLLAVVLAFTFQPLKRFFDRWSNKIFYRDAYDAQELLDSLNKVLVSTIEIERLLTSAAQVIATNLKAEFILFGITETSHSPQRILGTVSKEFSDTDISAVRQITPAMRVKTIVADELEDSQAKLRDLMRSNDIAALVRLTDTPNKRTEGLGYIVLGNKKSGSPFTQQDIKVLEIIADELVIAIQNALRFEEIKNFNVTLQDKVDDATKQLRKANQRLIELDQTKDDFISMASHQLRTPLTSVKGYISMVMEGDAGKITKKQTELLDQAFVSSQRMVYLIADLLNVSRLRTGKFVIEPKPTNLADVIEGEISQLKETAKGRNLELTYTKPKSFPELMLDETKIRQVIMNFADNAIYYTPQGGHIQVNLEDKGDAIEFTVVDDGIGVPKSEQHNLFNKFYRAGNAKKARPDGTGLGLFMAKKVVVAQGGSIIFKTQENKGSTFGFSFTKKALLPENFKGVQAKS